MDIFGKTEQLEWADLFSTLWFVLAVVQILCMSGNKENKNPVASWPLARVPFCSYQVLGR